MKQLFMRLALLIAVVSPLLLSTLTVMPAQASAACTVTTDAQGNTVDANDPKNQVLGGVGQTGNCDDSSVPNLINTIVNILSLIVGAVAVIMIIVSGFKYMTSGGDSGKVSSAKNTLIYAAIGIAVAVLAQLIVNVTITQSQNVKCGTGKQWNGSSCVSKP